MADPSALNDKESNMKVDLLPDVGRACFISLVKQRGKQSEHESMNNSRTFFLGNCLSCLMKEMAAGVDTEVSAGQNSENRKSTVCGVHRFSIKG